MTPLRKHLLADMQAQNLPGQTQELYILEVAKLAASYRRSPDLLGADEVRGYLEGKRARPAEYAGTVEALRFFYKHTLGERPRTPGFSA